MRPKSAMRYGSNRSGRSNRSRIEEDPDFLDDFNSRLVKLEERLQTSINERKRRNTSNAGGVPRSRSSWKKEFTNPDYKKKNRLNRDGYLEGEIEENGFGLPTRQKSQTPSSNNAGKLRNRRDLIKEYNESSGFDFYQQYDPKNIENKQNKAERGVPHRKPIRSSAQQPRTLTPELNNQRYNDMRSADIDLSSGIRNGSVDDVIRRQQERINTNKFKFNMSDIETKPKTRHPGGPSGFSRDRSSSIYSRKATQDHYSTAQSPHHYNEFGTNDLYSSKAQPQTTRYRTNDDYLNLSRNDSVTSLSSWKNKNKMKQSRNVSQRKKTTADLIKELTADIGSTYASLKRENLPMSNGHVGNYSTQGDHFRSKVQFEAPRTAKKPSKNIYKSKLLNTAPQKTQKLSNDYLNSTQQRSQLEEVERPSYFSRAKPISPPGSSYDALSNARQGLSRAYSNSSLQKMDRPMGYLERITNQKYHARGDARGRGFDKYQRECKEDLVLAKNAARNLNSKPVQNGSLRLHRDYDSNFNFQIRLFNTILELKTLILDLDETLIHAEDYQRTKQYDMVVDMASPGSRINDVSTIPPRPSKTNFLENWSEHQTILQTIPPENEPEVRTHHLHSREDGLR